MRRPQVLVISADVVGERMAGVGIRAYELARVLQPYASVTLGAPEPGTTPMPDVETITYHRRDPRALRSSIATADVIIAQPQWPLAMHWLRASKARLIFDLYDPEPLEILEYLADRPRMQAVVHTLTVDRIAEALRIGDHFLCASEKQRDMWLGAMLFNGSIEPSNYKPDPSLRRTIDKVPFGVQSEAARPVGGTTARGRFGLSDEAEVVLWNGGIWQWLDAPTAIRAVAGLATRRPQVRLVFMGTSPHAAARVAAAHARDLARDLGLLDRYVFFNEEWVHYSERADWLLEADCAISTQLDHLETRFAFRTRLLDCFWARLPVVCTRGDELADRVERDDLGGVAAIGDVAGVAQALESVLIRGRRDYEDRLAAVADSYRWTNVAAPLIAWVTEPPRHLHRSRTLAGRLLEPQLARYRYHGYRLGQTVLNRIGLRDWPSV